MKKDKNEIWYKRNTLFFSIISFIISLFGLIILYIIFLFINHYNINRFNEFAILGLIISFLGIIYSIYLIRKLIKTEKIRITENEIQIFSNHKIVNQIQWSDIKNIYYVITSTNIKIFYFDDGNNKPIKNRNNKPEYMLRCVIDHKKNEFFDLIKKYSSIVPIKKTLL